MGTLQFTRDGGHLVVLDEQAVTIVETGRDASRRIELAGVRAVAAVRDELWLVTADWLLARHGLDGRCHGNELRLPCDPTAALVPTAFGVGAVLWTAAAPIAVVEDLGSLVQIAPGADATFPLSARRWIRASGNRVTFPSGATLEGHGRLVGGSAIWEGNAVLLVFETPRGRVGIVAHPSTARVIDRVELPLGPWQVAARRGVVAILTSPHRIELIDVRLGRPCGAIASDVAILDFAIDHDGAALATRIEGGHVELAQVAEGTSDKVDPPAAEPAPAVALASSAPEVPAPAPDVAAAQVAPPRSRPFALPGLEPRPRRALPDRPTARARLDREMRTVALWTLQAIARGWDTRRIGYANEGQHPYEHEVAALVGMNHGFATDYVAAARAELLAHEAAVATDPDQRAATTPLMQLVEELGLSPTAVAILLVIAAPSLWAEAARLYGILGNDPGRALVDEALVHEILDARESRHDVAAALEPHAPLVRLGVVAVDPARGRPFAALTIDPVVLARLRGEVVGLGDAVVVRHAERALEALELPAGVLAHALAALATAPGPALRIAVRGRPGAGRRTLLAALAAEANRPLAVIDALQLPRDAAGFTRALRVALRRVHLAGLLPAIAGLDEAVFDERAGNDVARDVLRMHPGPLAIVAPLGAAVPLAAGHVAIDIPGFGETERFGVWQRALAEHGRWLRDPEGLAARYRVGPGTIHRAIAACVGPAEEASDEAIDAFVRQGRDARLGDHARRVDRLARWDDLVLPPDIMDSLHELVGRVRHRRLVFETWGMGRRLQTSRGITALFQGQPGTGKTLVAGVIARELGLELYQVDLSKVTSKWLGETERNLATIFDAAEDGQVILLFDEADSLFAKRTEVRSSNDRYANLEVNYLLQRLDAFEGIAILTTNSGGSIDPAFKRRMSFRLSFPFPDEETREHLWRAHIPAEVPRHGELVFDALARKYQLSGGYIRNACLRATFLAAQEETTLEQRHLERAVALEFAEVGKLSTSGAIS